MKFEKSLNDKEFMALSVADRVIYLNEHNSGTFRELTPEEVEKYTAQLERKWGKAETYRPYALREETSDVVVVNDSVRDWSPRMFMQVDM